MIVTKMGNLQNVERALDRLLEPLTLYRRQNITINVSTCSGYVHVRGNRYTTVQSGVLYSTMPITRLANIVSRGWLARERLCVD